MTRTLVPFHEFVGGKAGWVRGVAGESLIISQPKLGVEVVWVLWQEDGQNLYDQILRAERPGSVFIPVDSDGRIGLQRIHRPQARDQQQFAADFPVIHFEDLGMLSWEIPRGFSRKNETREETARREVESEIQGRMASYEELGVVCDNTAFSPHMTYASFGRIDFSKPPGFPEDPLEKIIRKVEFFSFEQVTRKQKLGELYCGYTLAALMALHLQHPDIF